MSWLEGVLYALPHAAAVTAAPGAAAAMPMLPWLSSIDPMRSAASIADVILRSFSAIQHYR